MLPPIDAHAHVHLDVDEHQLRALHAVVIAVTSGIDEWDAALERQDELTLWAVGCHPSDSAAVATFDGDRFRIALESAAAIGEVGLDGRSPTAWEDQVRVFEAILAATLERPRPLSIHSRMASTAVLDCLETRPQPAAILHWWRGNSAETERALELGCFFSLNGAEANDPNALDVLPPERVLTETDYPHSNRADPVASRPAAVATIETALKAVWGVTQEELRDRLWQNLETVFERADSASLLPARSRAIEAHLRVNPSAGKSGFVQN